MKLKKEVKRAIVVFVLIIIVIIIIRLIQQIDTTHKDLVSLGYTDAEATSIIETLTKEQVNNILENDYFYMIPKIITEKYYIPYNYDEYIIYAKSVNTEDPSIIVASINTNINEDWYTNTKEVEISNSMLVNKFNYITNEYTPNDLVNIKTMYAYEGHTIKEEVNEAYIDMWYAANKEDLTLLVTSSFRTYDDQLEQHNDYGDNYAARAGYSEHQTGLALDIVTYDTIGNDFENTLEFKWLGNNSYKYGFILRYPKEKEQITGYNYESWHYRYLGVELATKVYESNLSYDEYYAYYCEYKNEC